MRFVEKAHSVCFGVCADKAQTPAIAKIVKNYRESKAKISITKASDQIALTKSVWSSVEAGNRDPQLSTIWRMSESLNVPLSTIILALEKELGKDFFLE